MKRIISIVIALVMIVALLPASALAASTSGKCGNNITWKLDKSTGTLTISGSGEMYDYQIVYNEAPWNDSAKSIKTVKLGSGITRIGNEAFSGCSNLTSVNFPSSVKHIGQMAFASTGLKSAKIPGTVKMIGDDAFCGSSLTSVTICNGVEDIEGGAFSSTNLKSITYPASVTFLGNDITFDSKKLTNIYVNKNNKYYKSVNGVLFNKDGTMLWEYPAGRQGSYSIPKGVKYIQEDAFSCREGLKGIVFPKSIIGIGNNAFGGCENLTSVTIPASLNYIEPRAFWDCWSMKIYYTGTKSQWNEIELLGEDTTEIDCAQKVFRAVTVPKVTLTKCSDGIKIKWNKVANATSYKVYRYNTSNKSYTLLKTVKAGSTLSYKDTKATGNCKKYKYKVTAIGPNNSRYKVKSNYFVTRPAISSLKSASQGQVTAKWAENSKATGYQIRYSTSSNFSSYKTVTVTNSSTVSKTIKSLSNGKQYYVKVRAYKTVSGTKYFSAWSVSKTVTVKK